MKTGLSFSCKIWEWILIAGAISLSCCQGKDHGYVTLYGNLQPKQADVISSLLGELHEKYLMTMNRETFTIEVPKDRIDLIKHYMTAPVDSESYIRLIRMAPFAERDSSITVSKAAKRASGRLMRIVAPPGEHPDSLRIGAAFDIIFINAVWNCFRTPDYKIHVEFNATIPNTIRSNPKGMHVAGLLAENRENLLLEIGPEYSLWRFRWLVGIDGLFFKKESIRVIPGRFRPEGGKPPRETSYINL